MNVAELSPEKKLDYLRDCVLAIRSGGADKSILCPYCGKMNHQTNEFLCCQLFSEAMTAVVDRLDKQDAIDFMSSVSDRTMAQMKPWEN